MSAGIQYFGDTAAGGTYYGELIDAVRELLDAVTVTDAPDEVIRRSIDELRHVSSELGSRPSTGEHYPAGHRFDLPGRGHPLAIHIDVLEQTAELMRGRIRFDTVHMGHRGIAHGGSVAYAFDEALGVFPLQVNPPPRTAWLRVDYRRGAPVHADLCVDVDLVERVDRKMLLRGKLHDGTTTFAEAEGLFVQPRH